MLLEDRIVKMAIGNIITLATLFNHLGKKCFAFSSLDKSNIPDILAKFKDKSEGVTCAMQSKGV